MYFSISSLKLAATRVQCLIMSSSIQRDTRDIALSIEYWESRYRRESSKSRN